MLTIIKIITKNSNRYLEHVIPNKTGNVLIPDFFNFYGVPEVREAFRKLPGAGALHSDRIWAHIKPCRPHFFDFQ